jgi:hypothetical protein
MKQIDPIRPSFGASDETVAIVDVADGPRTPARQQGDSAPRVVLTGASSGIGRATALAFARQGASLVLASRNEPSLQDVAAACEQAGGKALACPRT